MLISLYPIMLSLSYFGVKTISTGISFLWLTCLQFFCCCCFDLFLFCFVLFVFRGGQDPSSFYTQPPSGFLSFVEEISLSIAYIWVYKGGRVVCDPPPPPNQELHLVLMLPYKYRLFNFFSYSKKLQRFRARYI